MRTVKAITSDGVEYLFFSKSLVSAISLAETTTGKTVISVAFVKPEATD